MACASFSISLSVCSLSYSDEEYDPRTLALIGLDSGKRPHIHRGRPRSAAHDVPDDTEAQRHGRLAKHPESGVAR